MYKSWKMPNISWWTFTWNSSNVFMFTSKCCQLLYFFC